MPEPAPERTPPDDTTAEDLREQISEAIYNDIVDGYDYNSGKAADAAMTVVSPVLERLQAELAEAKRWYGTYQGEVNARDEFFGDLLELLPGAEDEGVDAYDQIPRAIKALRTERDEARQVLAEEIEAIAAERLATRRADVLALIRERDALRAVVDRVERLRDKWLAWPEDDMHYAAGLMLARHLSGEAFSVDARPVSVESPGNDGFRYERAVALPPGVTADMVIARRGAHAEIAELELLRAERDNCLDRLRKAEGAYSRLDAQKRDLEGVRDRLRSRAEQAEGAIERVQALHVRNANTGDCEYCSGRDYPDYAMPWPCDTIRALRAPESNTDAPSPVTAATEAHGETTEAQEGCELCGGTGVVPGSEDYDSAVHMYNPTTGEPCGCQLRAAP